MHVIRNKDGKIISRSRNLRGIREAVGKQLVKTVSISPIGNERYPEGKLMILFDNGDNYETNFASYQVLALSLLNWRNLYGAPLVIDCDWECGVVEYRNKKLRAIAVPENTTSQCF